MPKTGVFPVFTNKFKIGKDGRASEEESMVPIAEMTSFSVSIDGSVQEWTPMDAEGWMKRMTTGKALTVSLSGKLCPGDPGNDYVAGLAWKSGTDCDTKFEWEFPSGAKLAFDAVVSVTAIGKHGCGPAGIRCDDARKADVHAGVGGGINEKRPPQN